VRTSLSAPGDRTPAEVLDEVYRRAGRRRARRRSAAILAATLVIGAAVPITALSLAAHTPPRVVVPTGPKVAGGLPVWTPPRKPARAAPAVFVDGDNYGGIGVWSMKTGTLIRTLSQTNVGPDQQPVLSADRRTVYFAQPEGDCASVIRSVPITGASAPVTVISVPRMLALEPSPSPDGRELAWVGVTCHGKRLTARLYITNLASGARTSLGLFSGELSDDGIAWSPDGRQLAVEDAKTIAVLDLDRAAPFNHALHLPLGPGCAASDPAFLPGSGLLAINETCLSVESTVSSSRALAVSSATGRPVALIAAAPKGASFVALSVDRSGQHILLGVVSSADQGTGSYAAEVIHGKLVTIGIAPSAEEW
jgi:hypothetical protein